MKFIKFILCIYLLLISTSFAQDGYPQEEKDWLIASLDSSFEQSSIVINIIDHRVFEALPKLEQYFWQKDCWDQSWYLKALFELESDKSYDYTKAFLDSLDNSTSEKYDNCKNTLRTKVEAIHLLYQMNDFSRVEEVFELLDREKANNRLLPYSVYLLPYIYKNIPEHRERAKQELLDAVRNSTDEIPVFDFTLTLTQAFGEEELPEMIDLFNAISIPAAKRAILQLYFTKVKNAFDLRGLLQETLPVETDSELRLYYIKVMLRGFSTTADYKFVQDYLKYNPTDSLEILISSELNRFVAYPPRTVPTLNMLDTLTSYTNQCYSYDWLKDETYKNELINKISTAKNYLTAKDSLACRNEVSLFQNSVNQVYQDSAGSYPKYVSDAGYKFLYYYAQYILDRLPEPASGLPVKLKDSQGNLLQGKYYEGSRKDAVNNGDGTFNVITERTAESIRMTYEGGSQQLNNVVVGSDTVAFQTVNAAVQLLNSQGNLITADERVQCYAGNWREFGSINYSVR